ncbi:hypothetical protein OAA09_00875 [bacterium]|nr:hypothetical protein [bacterium]
MESKYNIGDLITFQSDSVLNDKTPTFEKSGVIIQKARFFDLYGVEHEYLVVHWSDDDVGYIHSNTFQQIRILNKTGSKK